MKKSRNITLNVPVLARVEGEGALNLTIKNNKIADIALNIYEPPRLFEKLLVGRSYKEVPDIVARICGICPVAYQMSAVHALERIFRCQPGPWVRMMRRLIYCGEWIESHALHVHLLAAPDFLGFDNAPSMAKKYAGELKRGLRLQAVGNEIIKCFGGRSVHPVGVCVGGFYRSPGIDEISKLRKKLIDAVDDAVSLIDWVASFNYPEYGQLFTCVSLRHNEEYPFNEGRLISSSGLDIDIAEFEHHIIEHHVPHSTALHALLDGKPYLVGPLARLNLNYDRLPDEITSIIENRKIRMPATNMFHNILARAIEIYYAILEAIKITDQYSDPDVSASDIRARAGTGFGCTEAPRGILWHKYIVDEQGDIEKAVIVPPTSQNQARIEADLKQSLESFGLHHDNDELCVFGEKIIRNYDPCISCATHFLKIDVQRQD
ncbi:MAG: Ni/Fe hydrogenase subunit alpha [Gammaproteobacteria bacterium]